MGQYFLRLLCYGKLFLTFIIPTPKHKILISRIKIAPLRIKFDSPLEKLKHKIHTSRLKSSNPSIKRPNPRL